MFVRKTFYDKVRSSLFSGSLSQSQVDGMETLIDEYERLNIDPRWFGYILGTAFHEVARTMQPIEEYGKGAGKPYPPYYGRGFVQLTWRSNYMKMGDKLGHDLVGSPELALNTEIATQVIFVGMIDGDFAGDSSGRRHSLSRYFNDDLSDWYNARRIVNGLDKAGTISGYSRKFYKAILLAEGVVRSQVESKLIARELSESGEDTTSDFSVEDEAAFIIDDGDI